MSPQLPRWAWAGVLAALLLLVSGIIALAASAALTISVSPSTIDPSHGQTATVTYTNSVPVYHLSLTVRSSNNATVKSLTSNTMIGTNTRTAAWDGKDAFGKSVPNGQYTVVFAGTTSTGAAITPAIAPVTVAVAAVTPPPTGSVLALGVSPGTIDPSSGQTTTVTYTNTVSVYHLSLTVQDSHNTIVKSLTTATTISTNARKATWDGKDAAGNSVAGGQYTVVFAGTTSDGTALTPATVGVTVATAAPTTYAFKITGITPGTIDATQSQTTTVSYTVPILCDFRVSVKNSGGAEVRTLDQVTGAAAGSRTAAWNGKDSTGAIVPDGTYTVTVVSTSTTPTVQPASGTITIATATVTPPPPPPPPPSGGDTGGSLTISDSPTTIDPSSGQTTTVTYTNTVSVYHLSLTVQDSHNTVVKSLTSNTMIGTNTRKAIWDGKDAAGNVVAGGQYTVVFAGTTSDGTLLTPATAGVTVATAAPTTYAFKIISITPSTIDATQGQTTTITYNVPILCDLRVYVKNSGGTEVRTLTQVSSAAAGNRTITWDGKTTAGAIVPDGVYTVTVESLSATPTIAPASGTVTVKTATVTPPPPPPPPPTTGAEKGQIIEGAGSANFAWLKYAGYKATVAFQAPKSGAITQITLQWKKSGGYGSGTYGIFNFELQTNGAGNFPSGTAIGRAANINPTTAMDGYADGAFHFPISATLTAGQIYHLVITNVDPNPGTNWSSPNGLMTRVQTWDGTGNRLAYYSSGSWKPWSSTDNPWNTSGGNNVSGEHTPTMLTWSDGTNTGDPFYSAAISSGAKIYGTSRAGEYILWNSPTTTIGKVGVSMKKVGTPAGSLIYHLEKVGSGDIVSGTIASAADVGAVQTWVYAALPTAVTLTQGQAYRLWFESPNSSSAAYYTSAPVYGESRPATWIANTWGGTQSYYVYGSGSLSSSMTSGDLSFSLQ